MASPVYRGDDPGFQTQAVGNYPAKSDVADKDNIYLSDQGWVYRHFKNAAKTKYWDEVIWAGDVTNPPAENDPVDTFGAVSVDFLVGDGYQPANGPYPGVDPTIGAVTITDPGASGDTGQAVAFALTVAGALANNNTFLWSVDGPGTAVISNASGTFTGNSPAQANTNITFPTAGVYNVSVLIKTSAVANTGSIGNFGFTAITPAADTIGTVTLTGQATPIVGTTITYTAAHDGTAPEQDITYTWTANPSTGVTFATVGGDKSKQTATFTSAANSGTAITITASLADGDASDTPQTGTKVVTPHAVIGTPVITGASTVVKSVASSNFTVASYTGASNPAADDLTYAWTASPNTGVTFSAATAATTTVTVAAASTGVDITCTVGSVTSSPTTAASNTLTLVVTDS